MIELSNNNNLFEVSEGHVQTVNVDELERKTYFYAGQMMALSLLHGGPAPTFFTNAVVQFLIVELSEVRASADDV